MSKWQKGGMVLMVTILLFMTPVVRGDVYWHDPYLNWDFINQNPIGATINVNDFDIIVDAANWVPQQQWSAPFPNFNTFQGDYDLDGDMDTKCEWSGAWVAPGAIAHGGLYMLGSGRVQDAYWTLNGNKVYVSTPTTYERTQILDDPEVHMHLNINPGYFEDPAQPYTEAGWTNIRAFVNIPADALGLEDLTRELNLDDYAAYEVQPKNALTGQPILPTDQIWMNNPDSFFDVFLAEIDPQYVSPGYEALLHAEVITPSGSRANVVGEFWNLNPQSPEPATAALFAIGAALLLRRR